MLNKTYKKGDIVIDLDGNLYTVIEEKESLDMYSMPRYMTLVTSLETGKEKELATVMLDYATIKQVARWKLRNEFQEG